MVVFISLESILAEALMRITKLPDNSEERRVR